MFTDPYVKIWMVYEGKKVEKKKTLIHQKTPQTSSPPRGDIETSVHGKLG